MALLLSGCAPQAPAYKLTLAGAQIPVELVESWLNRAKSPRFRIEKAGPVYRSMHGFKNLIEGTADVACTDRRIGPTELVDLGDRKVEGYRIGFYGYALYVHPDNPLDAVYARHISYLFQRKLGDWKELSTGPVAKLEGPIRLIGPEKSTRGGEILMQQAGIWFANPTWEAMPSDAAIVDAVAADPMALGFASIGFDRGVRYLGLRMERNGPAALPSLEEIESERYGLAKVIYVYVFSPPSPAATAMLDYLFGPEGSQALEQTHIWPIPRARAAVADHR